MGGGWGVGGSDTETIRNDLLCNVYIGLDKQPTKELGILLVLAPWTGFLALHHIKTIETFVPTFWDSLGKCKFSVI